MCTSLISSSPKNNTLSLREYLGIRYILARDSTHSYARISQWLGVNKFIPLNQIRFYTAWLGYFQECAGQYNNLDYLELGRIEMYIRFISENFTYEEQERMLKWIRN